MYKLCFKKRSWIVKQYLKGEPVSKLAMAQKIHRSAAYQIINKYAEYGWDGLKDHKTGRPETVLNPKVQDKILDLRRAIGMAQVISSKFSRIKDSVSLIDKLKKPSLGII